jgi:hypothetical protein
MERKDEGRMKGKWKGNKIKIKKMEENVMGKGKKVQ